MMRLRQTIVVIFVALWAAAWLSTAALAGELKARTDKPLVIVLIDTSASMEKLAGTAAHPAGPMEGPLCEPLLAPAATEAFGSYEKSRLIVAKEILTGSYRDYWCRVRNDAVMIPQNEACSGSGQGACDAPRQEFDGLLDISRDAIKFAVMTFDGKKSTDQGSAGAWSYGPDKLGAVNLGIRNAAWGVPNVANAWDEANGSWSYDDAMRAINNEGQLIGPSREDDYGPVRERNRLAQYDITTTAGDGGSPVSAMLDDARYFLLTDSAVKPIDAGGEGDPLSACRERTVVLITDGVVDKDHGEGALGYPTTAAAVEALKATQPTGVRVVVVGFHIQDMSASIVPSLDPAHGGPADAVYYADNPAQLANALATVLSGVNEQVQSRTNIEVSNATQSSVDLQYQFSTSYQTDVSNPINLEGYLDQTVYRCSEACAAVSDGGLSCARELIRVGERLNEGGNTKRTLLAVVDGAVHPLQPGLVKLANTKPEMADLFSVRQAGDLPHVTPIGYDVSGKVVFSKGVFDATKLGQQKQYMRQLIRLIRADNASARKKKRLGAISRGTPVVQEPALSGLYPIRSWNEYVSEPLESNGFPYAPACRPTVLYVGTHDGLIHAFRIDNLDAPSGECAGVVPPQGDTNVGQELWAIMPHHLLKGAHVLADRYHFLMDGQLTLADALLTRSDPTVADVEVEARQWRSVLTAGYGKGGRGYIALDVTNALEGPSVLWEIDDEERCVTPPSGCTQGGAQASSDFSKLGLTTSKPAYGTVFLGGQEIAIAVLAGGESPDDQGSSQVGRVVYVVRLDSGEKIAEFSNTTGNVFDLAGDAITLKSSMSGSPAVFSDVPGVVSTRAFVGDGGGRLWRVDLTAADPENWRLQLFFDPYGDGVLQTQFDTDRQPVLGAPSLALQNAGGHLAVVYGTGALDYVSDQADTPRGGVFGLSEITGLGGDVNVTWNWSKVLLPAEMLTGQPMVFDRTAYFTAYVGNEQDACAAGEGRLYGVHFTDGTGAPTVHDNTVPSLDGDGDPATQDPTQFIVLGSSVPRGVKVVERPACVPDSGGGGGAPGASTRGDLELVVNVAKGSDFSAKSVPPGVDAASMKTRSVVHGLSSTGEMLQSAAWGYVLY